MKPSDYLAAILEYKRVEIQRLYDNGGRDYFLAKMTHLDRPSFFFSQSIAVESRLHLIAELKQASPSKGVINSNFNPPVLAQTYLSAGATCLSILTEQHYFKGHVDYIDSVRGVCSAPILRKDFIIDAIQVLESKVIGADAILLILAILEPEQVQQLLTLANDHGLDVIVEVHNEMELRQALALSGQFMIGINNRDLTNFEVDQATALNLMQHFKRELIGKRVIAESGYTDIAELDQLYRSGFSAVLIGEGLVLSSNLVTYFNSGL